jgi:hypothetical protein
VRKDKALFWLAGAVVAVACAVRAANRGITHDEALSYAVFLSKPWWQATGYSPLQQSHSLLVVLSKLFATVLPASALTIRLPSILAGGLFAAMVGRLLYTVVQDRRWALAGVAAIALNPYLLDFFSIARGYGLMLALLATGSALLLPTETPCSSKRLVVASITLGLAIAAVQVAIVPVSAVIAACFVVDLVRSEPRQALRRTFVLSAATVLSALPFVLRPALHFSRADYFIGAPSIDLWFASLVRGGWSYSHPYLRSWTEVTVLELAIFAVASTIAVGVLAKAVHLFRTQRASADTRTFIWIGVTMAAAFLIAVAVHVISGTPYPQGRTAIYWIPWLIVAAVILFSNRSAPTSLRLVGACLLAALLVNNVLRLGVRTYADWQYDGGTPRIIERILEDHARTQRDVSIAGSWELQPSVNFYRTIWHLNWLAPMDRTAAPPPGYDYYAFTETDRHYVDSLGLSVIYVDGDAHTVLAENSRLARLESETHASPRHVGVR